MREDGATDVEAGEAMVVAATFVQRYETLDARGLAQTLAAAEFVLTPNAQARFLGQVPNVLPDPRATAAFAARSGKPPPGCRGYWRADHRSSNYTGNVLC